MIATRSTKTRRSKIGVNSASKNNSSGGEQLHGELFYCSRQSVFIFIQVLMIVFFLGSAKLHKKITQQSEEKYHRNILKE